jgi:hypothetical protein
MGRGSGGNGSGSCANVGVEATMRTSRSNLRNIGALSWRLLATVNIERGHDALRRDPASEFFRTTGWDPDRLIVTRPVGLCPPEITIRA